MESAPLEVVVHHTVVETVTHSKHLVDWMFSLKDIQTTFYMPGLPCLSPGDRVRITITKEPANAQ